MPLPALEAAEAAEAEAAEAEVAAEAAEAAVAAEAAAAAAALQQPRWGEGRCTVDSFRAAVIAACSESAPPAA